VVFLTLEDETGVINVVSGGLDCLNRDRRWLSGIAAGCVSPWLALHAGRA